MIDIQTQIKNISVEAESSDECVYVTIDSSQGLRIFLASDVEEFHDSTSLADQLEETISTALREYEEKADEIRTSVRGENLAKDSKQWELLNKFQEAIDSIDVSASSPKGGYVKMNWMDPSGPVVSLKRDAIQRLSVDSLTREINSVFQEVSYHRHAEVMKARKKIYSFDRFAKRGLT